MASGPLLAPALWVLLMLLLLLLLHMVDVLTRRTGWEIGRGLVVALLMSYRVAGDVCFELHVCDVLLHVLGHLWHDPVWHRCVSIWGREPNHRETRTAGELAI